MSSLFGHCHGEKTHFSRNEKRTFSLSQMNNAELARTSSWRENALSRNEKNLSSATERLNDAKRATQEQKKRPGTTYHDARAKRRKTV